ncbi:hypothetical protein L3X38_024047 [Prunus dulcis]|uniref:Uncharacterized protein n=1 Tax=Prunus dulcis TaxID=3755 RepID=A0AAD4VZ26_PRUDU|nr:hypothetical protein L3X38_024047 [Prunus dulcis]
MLDELYAYAQMFSEETLENPLQEAQTVRNTDAEEGEMGIALDSMRIKRQLLAESGNEFLIPEQDFTSILHKYRCYLKQKQDVLMGCDKAILIGHPKPLMLANRDSTQQKGAEEDVPLLVSLLVGHVHVLAETQLYGSYSPAQWKRYLQAFLQNSQVATLSIKGDKISVLKHFNPWNAFNFCFPQKVEYFKHWIAKSSWEGIQLPPKLYVDKNWRGLVITPKIYNNCPALTVDSCGIRLLYQQDEEEFKQAIIQS